MNPLQKFFSHIIIFHMKHRQTDQKKLVSKTFFFAFFRGRKKKMSFFAFIFSINQRARVCCCCCCCCCCLKRGIDIKNDVLNEDCYQQKRFLFCVLPSSRSNIVETRENKLLIRKIRIPFRPVVWSQANWLLACASFGRKN